VQHAVVFVRDMDEFRPERRADELAVVAAAEVFDHLCYCCSVLRWEAVLVGVVKREGGEHTVEVGVDFVEEVEWCGVTLLDCKDEREGA